MGVVADQDTMFDQMKSTLFPLRSLRESRAIDVLQRVQHPSLMVTRNFIGASGTAGQGSKTEQKGTCGLHAERVTANRLGPAYLALRPIIPQSASNPSPPSWTARPARLESAVRPSHIQSRAGAAMAAGCDRLKHNPT